MKIAAYQFAVTKHIQHNMEIIEKAAIQASKAGVELLVFPECALTGYPPRDFANPACIPFEESTYAYHQLQKCALNCKLSLLIGTITTENGRYYNSAMLFTPNQTNLTQIWTYQKRALWGWDKEHFEPGENTGIFQLNGWKIGVRICFEVRFPELFRELYKEKTDLNVILFYDVSDQDNLERYELINSHIKTRAVENITPTLSVNTISQYQTAPTALYDSSGYLLQELQRNKEQLLIYEINARCPSFGEQGIKQIADGLLAGL